MFEANRDRVDLLVADLSLRDGDACDLVLQLRDRQPDLRVLFVSGTQERKFVAFTGWTRLAFIFSESLSRRSNFLKAFSGY
jgi:DNA-binding NarL/FixJ family response regulator